MTIVVTAPGAIRDLRAHIAQLGVKRAFVVTTGGRSAEQVSLPALLGDQLADVFSEAREHVPEATIASALERFTASGADACIAIGGGSAIGLGKAIARRTGVPLVAAPTTYSGSEMTSIWGETTDTGKRTGRDPLAKARLVIYDTELTLSLPADVSAASGMNAMAHAVEAMYAANASDDTRLAAAEAARRLAGSLLAIVADGSDLRARADAFIGARLAGHALEHSAMALHHRICHVLGGSFGLPHARTHAIVLPHVVAFNAHAAPDAMAMLGTAIGEPDVAVGLATLNYWLGLRYTLGGLGLREADVGHAADEVTSTPYPNPRAVTREDVRVLLLGAL